MKQQKNKKEGGATRQNIQKQIVKVQILHQRISNIRENYINQVVSIIVKQKPSYVTIEDLNVSGMMKNRQLSKEIAQQGFYSYRVKLTDREYICYECGSVIDRDKNASYNLANAEIYKLA